MFEENGILLVDKPKDWTSHDVVNFVRNRFNVPKVGHCGTLDPAATGLLVVVLGKFTKLSQKFSGEDKTYRTTILLGVETDSQDMAGAVLVTRDPSAVTEAAFREALMQFRGEQQQIPPMVSAVKRDGKKLYDLARQGIEIERDPKTVFIHSIEINSITLPTADFTVECSKGTYVRTLCHDIGRKLGCGAVLRDLRRTCSGDFQLEDAVTVETMKTWEQRQLQEWVQTFLHGKISKLANLSGF
jgi:tRNA pseudouridine55 synthase